VPTAHNGRLGRGGTPCRPHYHASAHPQIWAWRNWLLIRPSTPTLACARFFSFPAASAVAVTPEACPYHANPSVGAALRAVRAQRTPRRGAPTNTALVGAARHSRRSAWLATNREPRLRGGYLRAVRIPTNMGVAQLASHSPLYPNSRMRPFFFISCGVCRSGHAGGVPLPANPSVGAALRAVRAKRTPRRGVPTTWRPYHATAHYLNTHRIANGHSSASLQSHLRTGFFAT
jgi:hypothetical protein